MDAKFWKDLLVFADVIGVFVLSSKIHLVQKKSFDEDMSVEAFLHS